MICLAMMSGLKLVPVAEHIPQLSLAAWGRSQVGIPMNDGDMQTCMVATNRATAQFPQLRAPDSHMEDPK